MNTLVRRFGLQDYEAVWLAMRDYTDARDAAAAHEDVRIVSHAHVLPARIRSSPTNR